MQPTTLFLLFFLSLSLLSCLDRVFQCKGPFDCTAIELSTALAAGSAGGPRLSVGGGGAAATAAGTAGPAVTPSSRAAAEAKARYDHNVPRYDVSYR